MEKKTANAKEDVKPSYRKKFDAFSLVEIGGSMVVASILGVGYFTTRSTLEEKPPFVSVYHQNEQNLRALKIARRELPFSYRRFTNYSPEVQASFTKAFPEKVNQIENLENAIETASQELSNLKKKEDVREYFEKQDSYIRKNIYSSSLGLVGSLVALVGAYLDRRKTS